MQERMCQYGIQSAVTQLGWHEGFRLSNPNQRDNAFVNFVSLHDDSANSPSGTRP